MILPYERISRIKTILWSKARKSIQGYTLNRMTSFLLLSMMLPVALVPDTSNMKSNEAPEVRSNLMLSIDSPSVVLAKESHSEIKPGESKVDREAREKAEADAKAKKDAEAAKAAKAAAASKAAASRNVVTRENRVYSDPSNFDEIYVRAQNAYGVDARLLRAVHLTETGGSGSTAIRSGAGAQGPMQFLPSTWSRYGVDGNGDGIADINNVEDAIFSAAKYLKACGYPDVRKALWGYNPSTAYYNRVTSKM